jgi:predicted dithiol-disulfide oxidoreductase (DUF899 family)
MSAHEVVGRAAWVEARKGLLAREKEFTRLRDELSAQRRALPWERVESDYRFQGPGGQQTMSELFEGRSQLIVYHFMLGPDWEADCKSCSFWADSFEGVDDTLVDNSMSELPGLSVFCRDGGEVFHTYSCYARGLDALNVAYQLLDLVPKGRDEAGLPSTMSWLRRHDEYTR